MSAPNVLVSFRLDRDRPLRLRWLATDGVPGDGYKAQITAIKLAGGARLAMDHSAILEQTTRDPDGGSGAYTLTFSGMVGYAGDHPDHAAVDDLDEQEIEYDLEFIQDDTGRVAVEDTDFNVVERPRGRARKVTKSS